MKNFAAFVVGCMILGAVAPILPWIIGIGGVIFIVVLIATSMGESQLTEEEKSQRRLQQQEIRHAKTLAGIEQLRIEKEAEIALEQHKRSQAAAARNSALGVAGKVAVSVLMHSLTGGTHRHHH